MFPSLISYKIDSNILYEPMHILDEMIEGVYATICTKVGVRFLPTHSEAIEEDASIFLLKSSCASKIEWNKKTKEDFSDLW